MAKPANPFSYLPDTMADFVRQISPAAEAGHCLVHAPEADDPLDGEAIVRRCGGNREVARVMLERFAGQAMADLEHLASCIAARDAAESERLAHSFKGVAANLSAGVAQALAGEIERLAAAKDFENITGPLNRFRDEIARCVAAAPTAVSTSPLLKKQPFQEARCAP